ncbi:MAG: hypothetical protein NVS3B26_27850 [Mycobacteriales bacterium]
MLPSHGHDDNPAPHAALTGISWVLGSWWGFGVGGYPTIEDFRFEQELVFSHDGRPFLAYESRSWLVDPEGERLRPAARESGYWRAVDGGVEVVLSHPTGIVEVYVGEVAFHKIELATDVVARTQSAKNVQALKRLYGKVEEDLAYAVDMAAEGLPLQPHLSARLQRVGGPPAA